MNNYSSNGNGHETIELIEHHHAREYSLTDNSIIVPQTHSNNLPNRTILPTLSISGPSPPHQEEEFL